MNDAQQGRALSHGERSALESNAKKDRESDQQPGTSEIALIQSKGLGERAAGCARAAGAPAAAALPCQNSNNSNQPAKRYRLQSIPGSNGLFFKSKDSRDAV